VTVKRIRRKLKAMIEACEEDEDGMTDNDMLILDLRELHAWTFTAEELDEEATDDANVREHSEHTRAQWMIDDELEEDGA
jgi:hypothetical protein